MEYSTEMEKIFSYKGIIYSASSSVFFSLSAVFVKLLSNIDPGQLAAYRFLSILVIALPITIYKKENLFGNSMVERFYLLLRGIIGSANLYCNFLAYRYLSIGEASAIIFSLPVFVSFLARIFLKETCGLFQIMSVMLTCLGLGVISNVPTSFYTSDLHGDRIIGLSSAITSLFLGSNIFIILRKLKATEETVVLLNFAWIGVLETTALTKVFGNFKTFLCGYELWIIFALGIFSFCGQFLMTSASRYEKAGVVCTVRSATDIVMSFLWQILIFNNIPDLPSIVGAILVSFSVILLSLEKWIAT